jgi:hypothetical protein
MTFWQAAYGTTKTLSVHGEFVVYAVDSLDYSQTMKLLVSGSHDYSIKIWNIPRVQYKPIHGSFQWLVQNVETMFRREPHKIIFLVVR